LSAKAGEPVAISAPHSQPQPVTVTPRADLGGVLSTILRNVFYSHYRKRSREVQDSDGEFSRGIAVDGNQESYLDLADLRIALAKLPAEQREVLILVGASGVSYEEAAVICGVGTGTIKSASVALEPSSANSWDSTTGANHCRGCGPAARCLLDFAIESVVEGLKGDPECYSEADHAIACLGRIFQREASEDGLTAQLAGDGDAGPIAQAAAALAALRRPSPLSSSIG
jgi:hypothetical protein